MKKLVVLFSFFETAECFQLGILVLFFPVSSLFSSFFLPKQPQDEDQAHDHVFGGPPLLKLHVEFRGQRRLFRGELGLELPLFFFKLGEPERARGLERGLEVLLGWVRESCRRGLKKGEKRKRKKRKRKKRKREKRKREKEREREKEVKRGRWRKRERGREREGREREEEKREREGGDKEKGEREKGILKHLK